jgi:hypothetical protein
VDCQRTIAWTSDRETSVDSRGGRATCSRWAGSIDAHLRPNYLIVARPNVNCSFQHCRPPPSCITARPSFLGIWSRHKPIMRQETVATTTRATTTNSNSMSILFVRWRCDRLVAPCRRCIIRQTSPRGRLATQLRFAICRHERSRSEPQLKQKIKTKTSPAARTRVHEVAPAVGPRS